MPTPNIYPSKATLSRRPSSDTQSQSDTNVSIGSIVSKMGSTMNGYMETGVSRSNGSKSKEKNERRVSAPPTDDLDVQSIINERRPSKLKSGNSTGAMRIVGDQYSSSTRVESYGQVCVTEERSEEVSPMSSSNMSDSIIGSSSTSGSGSVTGSGSVNGSANGNGSRNGSAVMHIIGVCASIGSNVRIYVDDSASSNNQRKKPSEGTPEASTTISSVTAIPDVMIEEERSERFDRASSGGPSDPS